MDSFARAVIDAARATVFAHTDELHRHLHDLREALASFDGDRDDAWRRAIRQLAVETRSDDGDIEFDDDCAVSESSENGAYLEAWLWIAFDGSPLDKRRDFGATVGPIC